MIDPCIQEAVTAFESSKTVRTPRGLLVALKIREYATKSCILYDPLTPMQYGASRDYLFGQDIKVNSNFRGNVAATSLVIAHEGVHRVLNKSTLEEEMSCFELQDEYHMELLNGVSFRSPVKSGTSVAKLSPGEFPDAQTVHRWRSKDQLLDFILSVGTYAEKLYPGWIHANIRNWRGIGNRWATTKGHYVRILGSDMRNGQLILEILFSISQPAEWGEMLRVARSLAPARCALRAHVKVPVARVQILAIQNRWRVDLGAR